MSTNPSHPPKRYTAPPAKSPFQTTEACRVVWLRIAFSARFPSAHEAIDQRLCIRLRRSGINCWMTNSRLALLAGERLITAADWSAVIGWLLCQPEVVFVARELPLTRRVEVRP